jgi:hypothetical protein
VTSRYDQPVDVLVDGDWVPGWLSSWRRAQDGSWLGEVRYTRRVPLESLTGPVRAAGGDATFTWEQVRPAHELRPRAAAI